MIRIILIRHGHTAWNTGESESQRFRGQIDVPLAGEGLAQAQGTARRLTGMSIDAVFSSPLQRAVRTAEILAEPHRLGVHVLPGLASMNYGDWAGRLDVDVARGWPDEYRRWLQDPSSVRIPGGESMADFRARIVAAVHCAVQGRAEGAVVVLISHEAVCKTLACALMGMPAASYWRIRQGLCSLSSYDFDPAAGCFSLVSLNDTWHLDKVLPRAAGDGVRIILIRHGQTAWNLGAGVERFRGRTDLPLDEVGHTQARAVARRLGAGAEGIAALYASPLLRARQTLEPLAEALALPVQLHEGLLDINYGEWQGLTHAEAAASYPEQYALWRTRPGQVRFPGGESLADVQLRLMALLDELAARHPGQTVALVGHQIVNKVTTCTLLGLDLDQIGRIQQDTCGFDVFQQVNGEWHTLRVNDQCAIHGAQGAIGN